VRAWFEEWPDLERWELERFDARGLPAEVDELEHARGIMVVRSEIAYRGEMVPIEIRYPSEYPELPPLVYGPLGLLDRHQHVFDGNFCLLESPMDSWNSADWGAADLIAEQLRALLDDSAAGPETVAAREAPMAEPVTIYYEHPLGPVMLMDDRLAAPDGASGELTIRVWDEQRLRMAIEAIDGTPGDPRWLELVPRARAVSGRWLRIPGPPPGPTANDVLHWLRTEYPDFAPRMLPPKLQNSRHITAPPIQVIGLLFDEERYDVGARHPAWLFLALHQQAPLLVHHMLIDSDERFRRAPGLKPLTDKRVLIVGAGTLGGHVAVELARAGVGKIAVADFDRYEFGNSIRHALPFEALGLGKAEAVAIAIRRTNPYCDVQAHQLMLGAVRFNRPPIEDLEKLVRDADIVVEGTGSQQIAALVARVSRSLERPMVTAGMTNGYLGADVARIIPNLTCCYVCFAHRQRAGTLATPEEGDAPAVGAHGCSHPAVIGSGFDALEVAAVTTRLTIQTLLDGNGYPQSPWDHAAFSFLRVANSVDRQRVVTESLPSTEECMTCGASAGFVAAR
jgi:molybdopterin/thiamine biosynthesis adenylyltransferase/ubiquitin-protein ligase